LWQDALKVAERIKDARERVEALEAIAIGMGKAGVQDEALWQDALEAVVWIHAWLQALALGAIAEGMGKAGVQDEALWQDALQMAEWIHAWNRAGALREIAEGMAKAGMTDWAKEVFDQALKVAEGIEGAWERAETLKAIAEGMAKAGEVEGAVGIVEREMAVRTEGLPFILSALAERAKQGDGRSKEGFLRLFPLCGWSLEFAYKACRLLHQLYPERGEEIAGVVSGD
jgi:hypothetical protein